ncbi:MAG: hypothetical protein E7381_02760 [Clostridiales bacterium]|nr:hypothetical protein [Clostridiales bacterium]
MQKEENSQEEQALESLLSLEDLAEKKMKIFSRILMDASVAKDMESLSLRHEHRKEELAVLLGKKRKSKKSDLNSQAEEEKDET